MASLGGRVQLAVVGIVSIGGFVMAREAIAGPVAGIGFMSLAVLTAATAIVAVPTYEQDAEVFVCPACSQRSEGLVLPELLIKAGIIPKIKNHRTGDSTGIPVYLPARPHINKLGDGIYSTRNAIPMSMLIAPYPDGCVVVRLVCYGCGWQRIIGYSGWNRHSDYWSRSLIRIAPSESECNLVHTVIHVIRHSDRDPNVGLPCDDFRDLDEEAHAIGSHRMQSTFDELLAARKCPRCRLIGRVKLGTHSSLRYVDLAQYRTWRLIQSDAVSRHDQNRKRDEPSVATERRWSPFWKW